MTWQRSVLAVLIGIVVTLATIPIRTADANEGTDFEAYEAKIEARQLDDGSIEVAVRAREIGGEWGDRLYPPHENWVFFAPGARWTIWSTDVTDVSDHYRHYWKVSGPIGADRAYDDGSYRYQFGHGLRIVSRLHEDGRTEIGLRLGRSPGLWTSPLIFPKRRFFPAEPGSGWYETSTVTVSNDVVAPDGYPSDAVAVFVYEDALNRVYHYAALLLDGPVEDPKGLHAEIEAFATALRTFPSWSHHDCLPSMLRSLGMAAQELAYAAQDRAYPGSRSWPPAALLAHEVTSHIRDSVAARIACFIPV